MCLKVQNDKKQISHKGTLPPPKKIKKIKNINVMFVLINNHCRYLSI